MARPGFSDIALLHRGARTAVYRARRDDDQRRVILKGSTEVPVPRRTLDVLEQEHRMTAQFDTDGICRVLAWIGGPDPVIVLDDAGGRSLDVHVSDGALAVEAVYAIAKAVAEALSTVHASHVVHRDICPNNIVWNPDSGVVELIDFGLATNATRQHLAATPVRDLIGTLAYLPPEQSGRMNRAVDARSDLYGLGATLFHLLAGRPPFVSEQALDVVHAHIAREAPDLARLRPEVPESLAAIVAKLLAKAADDRYQSADGLLADLRTSHEATAAGNTSTFRLGRIDHSADLRLPDRTVGRDHELATLRATFERVAEGRNELVLVRGYPGIGKTRYVNEIQPDVATRQGLFLAGKFDQFQRATPYAAILQTLDGFARSVLAEPDHALSVWRDRLGVAVGDHGQLLIDAVPAFGAILPPQLPVERLPPAETETRFALLLRRVVQQMSSDRHPVVLFFDDLQWADLPSLSLLRILVTDTAAHNTLLIGAFRDNELSRGDPLLSLASQLRDAGATVQEVGLAPLTNEDVEEICVSAFGDGPVEVRSIASVLFDKSRGNPFYLGELLGELQRSGVVRRDPGTAIWRYDLDEVAGLPYSDDVVQFVAGRLSTLDPATAELLAIGSMLGPSFELADAASLANLAPTGAADALVGAVRLGAIERRDSVTDSSVERESYRFTHDRVQQAAAGLVDRGAALRLEIAEMLSSRPMTGNTVFGVVEHAIAAADLIPDDRRVGFAEHAIDAGVRAKTSAAFEPALRYLQFAWSILGDPWTTAPQLARQIALEGAEAAYLVGDEDQMRAWTDDLVARTDDVLTRLRAEEIAITYDVRRQRLDPAINRALAVLRSVGVSHPDQPSTFDLLRGVASTKFVVGRRTPDELAALPVCEDEEVLAAMRLQMGIASAAYYARPQLLPLIMMSLVKLSVKHGIGPESAFGFAGWGLVTSSLGTLDAGRKMGDAALAIDARLTDRRLHHRTVHLVYTHVYMWHEPWRTCRDELAETHVGCWQGGDVEYAAFSAMMTTMMAFVAGDPLTTIAASATRIEEAVRSLGNDLSLHTVNMIRQMLACLAGEADDPLLLEGEIYDGPSMRAHHEAAGDATSLYCQGSCEAVLATTMGRPARVLEIADGLTEHEGGGVSSIFQPLMVLHEGLAHARLARVGGGGAHLRAAKKALSTLEKWVGFQPKNLAHRVALLRGEIESARGRVSDAVDYFEAAISGAEAADDLATLALACEFAGRVQADAGHAALSTSLLAAARGHYERWGAAAKVAALDAEFPLVASQQIGGSHAPATFSHTSMSTSSSVHGLDVDVAAIVEASAAISRNVDSDGVLETLLALSVELAGASRGVLLLIDGSHITIHSEAVAEERVVVNHVGEVFDPAGAWLPDSMVSFVMRSETDLLVDDVGRDQTFASDPYLVANGIQSATCVPVSLHGNVAAILYVENAFTPSAFTRDRIAPVKAIVAQAAISLENARVYESLELRVRERSADLIDARKDAEEQRDRADSILLNVLPERIADELKRTGRAEPTSVESATVLFTDFVGFTPYSATVTPEQLVAELERCFTAFDEIIDECGITKLKTIGDAYMAVGGLPTPSSSHAHDTVRAALRIAAWMADPPDAVRPPFDIRIGVHTGPLVAGVIGRRRFLYDVWGDTVNIAARLESHGVVGRVNISSETRAMVEDQFACTSRGLVALKGKGEFELHMVEHELSP